MQPESTPDASRLTSTAHSHCICGAAGGLLCSRQAARKTTAQRGLDQQAHPSFAVIIVPTTQPYLASLHSSPDCLIFIDTFRTHVDHCKSLLNVYSQAKLKLRKSSRCLIVEPKHPSRGRVVLLHGALPAIAKVLTLSPITPGVWTMAGTAVRLARAGLEVYCPDADHGAGRSGPWIARTKRWLQGYDGPLYIVGFSFGGSSAVLLLHALPPNVVTRVVLLDPAVKSRKIGAMLPAMAQIGCPVNVLFAETFKTHGRHRWARECNAQTSIVSDTTHKHFMQPLGVVGNAYALLTPAVDRVFNALDNALIP